jgi:segregation and condensation protein A
VAVEVSTPVFEGPVDLLFALVSEHKVDIYDVPLADVVDAFVARIAEVPRPFQLHEISEFLLVASILLELKSRALLPGPDSVEDDEELAHLEERDRLLARLLELQAYSEAAGEISRLMQVSALSVPRTAGLEEHFCDLSPDLLAGVAPSMLGAAWSRVLSRPPAPTLDLSHVTVEAVTVSEAVEELIARLPLDRRATFAELTSHCTTKMQVIVRFLALLELFKRGQVLLEQGETFGDLQVRWTGIESGRDELSAVSSPGHTSGGGHSLYDEYGG